MNAGLKILRVPTRQLPVNPGISKAASDPNMLAQIDINSLCKVIKSWQCLNGYLVFIVLLHIGYREGGCYET